MGGRKRNSGRFYLHWGKQGKHIQGNNNFDSSKSPVTITKDEIEDLFVEYGGAGMSGNNKVLVNFGKVIGKVKNPNTGKLVNTTWAKIHFDKKGGYHIVPKWNG